MGGSISQEDEIKFNGVQSLYLEKGVYTSDLEHNGKLKFSIR